jgi:hypothetical protein
MLTCGLQWLVTQVWGPPVGEMQRGGKASEWAKPGGLGLFSWATHSTLGRGLKNGR